MPLDKYFKGKGDEVKKNMQREYGGKKGKQVFYATINKRKKIRKGPRKAAFYG